MLKMQSGHDVDYKRMDGRMDGQSETSIPLLNFVGKGYKNQHIRSEVYQAVDWLVIHYYSLILGLCPANERWSYFVTTSLIGWVQA